MISRKNNNEVARLRKKIKTMKVQNWLVSVNSPLHKEYQYNNPNPLRQHTLRKKAKSKEGFHKYISAG